MRAFGLKGFGFERKMRARNPQGQSSAQAKDVEASALPPVLVSEAGLEAPLVTENFRGCQAQDDLRPCSCNA